jgi:hypothetical protein
VKIGVWLIAGTPLDQPYPCRCSERMGRECSAAWCPCAGRSDPQTRSCCAHRFGPAEHKEAMAAWRIRRMNAAD